MSKARPVGVRREVRAALLVVVAVLLFSVLGGVLWGLLAPTEKLFVAKPGIGSALTGESMHRFDALAIFVCIGGVIGVLSAFGAWRLRAVRGPILQVGLLVGSVAGAVVMSEVGAQIAQWQHPRPHNPPVGQIVLVPVELGSWLALIVQPMVASLVVLFLAALSSSEHLGTGFSGPFGESRPVHRSTFAAASTFDSSRAFNGVDPYRRAANGGPVPYGHYEPARDAGSGPAR